MQPRERIDAVFAHRPTDRVPAYHSGLSCRAASAVLGREAFVGGGIQQWRESCAFWQGAAAHQEFLERSQRDAIELARVLDQDLVRPSYWRLSEMPARRIDEHTFLYGDPDGAWVARHFDPETELYHEVDRHPQREETIDDLPPRVEALERVVSDYVPDEADFAASLACQAALGHERAVPVWGGVGAALPQESTAWLEAIVLRPDLVARFLDAQAERSIKRIEFATQLGIRYFMAGGDFAGNEGPFYSPRAYRELVLPRIQRITETCHRLGAYYMFASDGNLWPVAEDLFGRSGIDGYYEVDRRAGMDLARLRRAFPHLTLIGNISSHTLHTGTKEEVVNETLSCIEEAKRSGSIVVGCSNQIVTQTPLENLFAMLETIERYR